MHSKRVADKVLQVGSKLFLRLVNIIRLESPDMKTKTTHISFGHPVFDSSSRKQSRQTSDLDSQGQTSVE